MQCEVGFPVTSLAHVTVSHATMTTVVVLTLAVRVRVRGHECTLLGGERWTHGALPWISLREQISTSVFLLKRPFVRL